MKAKQINSTAQSIIYGQMRVQHITQEQLAERIGIHRNTLANKLGNMSFTVWELKQLVKILHISNEDVLRIVGR